MAANDLAIVQALSAAGVSMAALAEAITGLPMWAQTREQDAFVYSPAGTGLLSIAAGANQQGTFTVQTDADFLLMKLSGAAVDPADEGVEPFGVRPPLMLEIFDRGSGRQLFDRAQPWGAVVGTAERPYFFGRPKLLKQAAEVTVTITNNDPTQALRVRLAFSGFKLFPSGTPR